ncbi:nucleoside diphosphate kinase regulator [Cognatiluteimonas weifangensis]|uniref:Nucleoside diphosphate kinase regulator n=1 Tax=Cognatiluteimonas weifangensis TaxID=2303539 RepID=A0A372DJY7_9GAMM|nr:nucleoside diphosphate kinase regulator [Luteimonas weifangensis]RFP59819.1 nucleoside diphosphate kinase regulator [Luteimonas weifangensis]
MSPENGNNPAPPLIVSRLDCERIEALLEQAHDAGLDRLREELARAELREPKDMPGDVITMNSTARFRDEASGEERELTLVYPRDATGGSDRVSILAPVGSALLGLRVDQTIEWPVPGGRTIRLRVLEVRYQPEAAGEYHR